MLREFVAMCNTLSQRETFSIRYFSDKRWQLST